MIRRSWRAVAAVAVLGASAAGFTTLKGSHEKMVRQNTVAHEDHFQFAQTPEDIARLVAAHQLVALPGSVDYSTKGVSFAFARPQVLNFVERLAYEYQQACGQPLVITSLVRPISLQPRNASPLSVHPAGMAVDLHVPEPPNAYTTWAARQPPVPVAPPATGAVAASALGPARAPAASALPQVAELDVGKTLAAVATMLALAGLAGVAVVRPLRARSARRGRREEPPPA